jgi:hypothetical protein
MYVLVRDCPTNCVMLALAPLRFVRQSCTCLYTSKKVLQSYIAVYITFFVLQYTEQLVLQ